MSFMGGMASGPASGLRFATTRGRINGSNIQGVNYPSPFFDIAHTYLPVTVKQLFKWCRYYFLTNPLINATVFKLSEYPVTDIIIDHDDPEIKKRWTEYFQDHLRYRSFQVESGLDFHAYGNGYVSLGFPFKKYLFCTSCSFRDEASKIRANWIFTNFNFRLTCPRCGHIGDATPKDQYYKNASGIKTIRWNPEDVEVRYNDMTGDYTYFYDIPAIIRNDIVIGRKDVVDGIPQVFIQAMREQKGVIFSKDNFFHMRRPTLAGQDRGVGVPLLLPVLKDTFYLQIMKKAQEAILVEHIVPLRILFPQAGSGSSDPYCVAPETLVETPLGLRPASEIGQGDYLRSHTGAWRRVVAQKTRPVAPAERVFEVRVASLPAFPFKVSEDHPILAVPRTSVKKPRQGLVDPAFIPVRELKAGDYVAYPAIRKQRSQPTLDLADYLTGRAVTDTWVYRRLSQGAAEAYEYLETLGDPLFAWGERRAVLDTKGWREEDFLNAQAMRREGGIDRVPREVPINRSLGMLVGYYLAEGSAKGDTLVSFALNNNEEWIATRIEEAVKDLGFRGVSRHERPESHSLTVGLEDVLLSQLLMELCGCGFASKRLPDVIAEAPDAVVLETLRALFEGDGCFYATETKRLSLKLSNPSLILEARRLLLSFGYIGCVAKEVFGPDAISKADAYQLNYNGEAGERVMNLLMGCSDYLPHPSQRVGMFREQYVLMRIDSVEAVADVPEVIGFEMDEDKSFCVAGVATHNTTINLIEWRDQVAKEIAHWRTDNNYIPILPLPVGNQTIGGDGRALLLTQEIQAWSEHIMVGMGVPREFLMGGMSYAGTNVSMRMLENMFIGYLQRQRDLARFIMRQVSSYLGWPMANIRFKPFKMADDLQRKAYEFQLNQAGKLSDTTLLASSDYSQEDENQIMIRETDTRLEATKKQQLAMATIQGESQLVMMKYQARAQQEQQAAMSAGQAPGEPGGADGPVAAGQAPAQQSQAQPPQPSATGGSAPQDFLQQIGSQLSGGQRMAGPGGGQVRQNIDLPSLAQMQARTIATLPKQQQEAALTNLGFQSPELADLVRQYLAQLGGSGGGDQGSASVAGVDTRPLPQQRPPRRAGGT